MPFNIDSTIHLSDIIVAGGGIYAFLKMFLKQRDFNRDIVHLLKGDFDQPGLVERVKTSERGIHRLRSWVHAIQVALAQKGIPVEAPQVHQQE